MTSEVVDMILKMKNGRFCFYTYNIKYFELSCICIYIDVKQICVLYLHIYPVNDCVYAHIDMWIIYMKNMLIYIIHFFDVG